jgi:selenophosphate synthetase-related protein
MSLENLNSWIKQLKKVDTEKHADRVIIGKPLQKSDCELCKILAEMNDAAVIKEDLEFT